MDNLYIINIIYKRQIYSLFTKDDRVKVVLCLILLFLKNYGVICVPPHQISSTFMELYSLNELNVNEIS